MKTKVYNLSGKATGEVELDDGVFGAEVKEHLFWEVVRWQLAKRRAGTHSTKHRSDVTGTGAKPYRQKGTGRARRGTLKSGHHVGGAAQFGPKPRDYGFPVNKKVRRAALKSALSLRAGEENGLRVIDSFPLEGDGNTKAVSGAIAGLGLTKALIVDTGNDALNRSARNLPNVKYLPPEGLNVYDILKYDTLVITTAAAEAVTERLSR